MGYYRRVIEWAHAQVLARLLMWTILMLATYGGTAYGAKPVWYEPLGCEFKVAFPQAPQVNQRYIQGVGYVSTATGGVDAGESDTVVLVAEALQFDPAALDGVDRVAYLMENCRQYAEFNGLEHVEYTVEIVAGANAVSLRGGKKVDGVRVLYLCKAVLGIHSLITLRAGGAATGFPQPGILQFVESVRRQ